ASRVGGWSYDENGKPEAVIWDRATNARIRLGKLPFTTESQVLSLSADGRVAVGFATGQSAGQPRNQAFRWEDGELLALDSIAEEARAVSADGSVVVGGGREGAFVWDAQHGARPVLDVLRDEYHLSVESGGLDAGVAVSADGKTLAGEHWRARLRD